jgi:hypothetical protein
LSESIDEAKEKKDGTAFIRQLMLNLINGMSHQLQEDSSSVKQEV